MTEKNFNKYAWVELKGGRVQIFGKDVNRSKFYSGRN